MFFRHDDRGRYFAQVPDGDLRDAVVFLDPDNGFEVPSMSGLNGHKYVRWDEAKSLYDRMGEGSVMVVYQHLPRVKVDSYLEQRMAELQRHTGASAVGWILKHPVAYLVAVKGESCVEEVNALLRHCGQQYGFRFGSAS